MTAAGQRRVLPWLVGICLLLGLLWATLLSGLARDVTPPPAGTPKPLPPMEQPAKAGTPPPLPRFAEIWQRPLLSMDRKPLPLAEGEHGGDIDQLVLTGVILTPDLRMALLTSSADGHTVRVQEGTHVANSGWVLKKLQARNARFTNNGQVVQLALKVRAGTDTAPTTKPARGKPDGQ